MIGLANIHHGRLRLGIILLALSLAASFTSSGLGQIIRNPQPAEPQIAAQPGLVRGDEITEPLRQAVEKGLARLASRQKADGTFGITDDAYGATSAVTSLAGLAFMEAGNLPGRGKYGANVQKCVDAILKASQESGLLVAEQAHAVMYSHGFATLFLAEVYGMTGDDNVKEKLQRAVQLIQKVQNPEGGWRYQPEPFDADISVTICQVMALRAARDAGLKVEKDVIDKAVLYVRQLQNPDGGFNYQAGRGQNSAFPRSAAGVAALYYAGIFEGDDLKRGLDYVRAGPEGAVFFGGGRGGGGGQPNHYFYGQYYAVQAMFLAGGNYWAEWFPRVRTELLAKQDKTSGGWPNGEVSEDYCTAMALIILQVPNRYLPVFSGKGPGS
ncbi:MAG TPA: prenyltransferase/squalene oxidase repeat-containing protein [Tepidisphaeraceae bacterium]|nr:prenyltransferase/squalene oxidase repeat-containing protein [Tepidisphaeraceae bacterium]